MLVYVLSASAAALAPREPTENHTPSHGVLLTGVSNKDGFFLHPVASLSICFTRINRMLEIKAATN
ncbi:hypothetical protein EYZ11_001789 [Aspergillus tanneri]|uniref:Uncharacterized protein n=1 Tax=Aspergillus tanneri TaxID=1220188 RepID=A0A4S3JSL2_9EURO|nr:hypothetical protein EYZ11_001789 [Aspergillus tanneri]